MITSTTEIPQTPYSYRAEQRRGIEEIASRVCELRQRGSLSPKVLHRIRSYFRIKNIYHSNAIEGNLLDVGETRQVVEMGLTITGKPLKDQAEAKNLASALDFLEELATRTEDPISEHDVRQIHALVLKDIDDGNAGVYRRVDVEISGSQFKPPGPEQVPLYMEEFSTWLMRASCVDPASGVASVDAVVNAVVAHTWLVYIHPFIDGNGRVARLLMNLMLMRAGFPITVITREDRYRYYDALEESQSTDLSSFIALVTEAIHESLEEYEDAAKEQREQEEWARSLASRFDKPALAKAQNEYEVWRSAMDLLKSYMKQAALQIDASVDIAKVYFKDFGTLEFEKYLSLRQYGSAKKTWFLRLDFVRGDKAARYLFFFGSPSHPKLKKHCDVTLHVAREEPASSFYYQHTKDISKPDVPAITEIGYKANAERFVAGLVSGDDKGGKIERLGRMFFEDVISKQFAN